MTRRSRYGWGVAVVAVCVAAGLLIHQESSRAPAARADGTPTPPSSARSPVATLPPAPPVPPTSPANAPTGHRADLEQRAAAGDADAAAELGGLFVLCRHYQARSAEELEDDVISGMADGEEPPRIAGTPASPELVTLIVQQSQSELDRRCSGIDAGKLRWEDAARAPALLERAADAGRVQAMLDYARYAFADYGDTEQLLADADEVIRRKEKARAFLRQALRRGEAQALLLLGDAYASGPLEKIDPARAYAYMSAFFESPAAQDWPPRLREGYLQALAQRLDTTQIARARADGEQIYRDFQAGALPQ